jgi:two-component system sensor histidine kinase PilS (NtrC family)
VAAPPAGAAPAAPLRQRLVPLLAGRLVLALAILAGALAVTAERARGGLTESERGLYATVVAAFVATIACAAWSPRVRRLRAFAAAQLVFDVAVVSALVHFSGDAASFFAFLYVPITVYAALLFGRAGAYGASALAAASYAVVLALHRDSLFGDASLAPVRLAMWGTHAGALLLVALLASALSRERDRAGRALAEKTRDLKSLQRLHERTVDSLTSGLLTTDPAGTITSWNPEAERITGVPERDALGRSLDDVIAGASQLALECARSAAKERVLLRFRDRSGAQLHLGLSSSVLRAGEDSPGGFVVIFQDVTKVVEMEAALRRHERLAAVGQLAADLAHEIRNPLAAISGSIQILEAGSDAPAAATPESDEARRLMSIVLRETDRLNALITDFLHYARPAPPKPEPVAIAAVLDEMRQILESVRPPSVRLVIDAPPGLRLLADDRQLRQLLWNLYLNGVQAMPDGGTLTIRAAAAASQADAPGDRNATPEGVPAARYAAIEVSDTGTGMSAEVLERIFDPFFTTREEGSGLGLATVHRIVEGNGGHVSVESAVGRGTRFRVMLPVPERAEAQR